MDPKFSQIFRNTLVQSVLYLPHFVSWVVVVGICMALFSQKAARLRKESVNCLAVKSACYQKGLFSGIDHGTGYMEGMRMGNHYFPGDAYWCRYAAL